MNFLPPALDPCCGSMMMYFQKNSRLVITCDNRQINTTLCDGRNLTINPDVLCDFRELPFLDKSFLHVIFDPPHLISGGDKSWIIKKYGRLPAKHWRQYLSDAINEIWRVLAHGGTLVFKWSEEQIPLSDVLPLFPDQPVYANLARNNRQIFIVFRKHPLVSETDNTLLSVYTPSSKENIDMIRDEFQSRWNSLLPGGTLVLQTENHPVNDIQASLPVIPLYGNRVRKDKNVFLVFIKQS